jgi:hypothetical protein
MLDSVGHNLLHALEWEQHDYKVANKKERWDLDEKESAAVTKWIESRIQELKRLRDGNK